MQQCNVGDTGGLHIPEYTQYSEGQLDSSDSSHLEAHNATCPSRKSLSWSCLYRSSLLYTQVTAANGQKDFARFLRRIVNATGD